jgi:hypothetical protein
LFLLYLRSKRNAPVAIRSASRPMTIVKAILLSSPVLVAPAPGVPDSVSGGM